MSLTITQESSKRMEYRLNFPDIFNDSARVYDCIWDWEPDIL